MLAAVSLMFPYLFGLGSLLFLVCGSIKGEMRPCNDSYRLQLLACMLVLGIELNHSTVLLLSNLSQSLMVGCALSILGLIYFIVSRVKGLPRVISLGWLTIFISLYVACLLIVLTEPLHGWDARSIWFFHGKMIFYNAFVDAGGDWSLPSIGFSHPDYPELIPILAAQIAFVAGYWNEYLPKLSLVALLLPAVLSLMSILRGKWWHIIFIAVPLLFTHQWLKNGYMDGYLALYAGLATFFWGRWLDNKSQLDLISGILFLGVVLDLKNEGMLIGLIIGSLVFSFICIRISEFKTGNYVKYFEGIAFVLISMSGLFLWGRKKQILGLQNDLDLGLNSLPRIYERLADGSLAIILKHLYVLDHVNMSLGIFLLSLVWTLRLGRRPSNGAIFSSLVGIFYFCGIVLIYLATPFDLVTFHLPTGERTMLPVHIMLLAATLSLYRGDKEALEPSLIGTS